MRAYPSLGGRTCRKLGVRMPNDASRPGFPEGGGLPPSRRLLCGRFGKLCSSKFPGVVLADAGYGHNTQFRTSLTELGIALYRGSRRAPACGNRGKQPLPAPPRKPVRGAMPTRLQRNAEHHPISVKQLALACRLRPGRTSLGDPALGELCDPDLPPCASCASMRNALNPAWKNGSDRVAEGSIGTDQILILSNSTRRNLWKLWSNSQTSLGHRTRL